MSKKNSIAKKLINILLTVSLIGLFAFYFFNNKNDLQTVLIIDPKYFIIIVLLTLGLFFLEGLFIKIVLKAFNKEISAGESFYVSTLSRIGNYLLPMRAGIAMRAAYLKKKFSFPYSQFISTLYGYYIILFLLYSLFALIGLGYKFIVFGEAFILLAGFFGAIFIGMLFFSLVRIPINKFPALRVKFLQKILNIIKKVLEGWNIIIGNKTILLRLFLVSLGNIVLSTTIFWVEFIALGIKISIANVFLYSSLSGVSLLISVTPGSLGLREAIFIMTSQSLGLTNEQIMQMALLDRGIMFGLLILLSIFVLIFTNRINAKKF